MAGTKRVRVNIDPEYAANHDVVVEAQKLRASLSPYDIPYSATASYNEDEKIYSIDLHYLTPNEPTVVKEAQEDVYIVAGKTSGKVYGIRIHNQEKENLPQVQIDISSAVDSMMEETQGSEPSNRNMHYALVKDVVQHEEDLYAVT